MKIEILMACMYQNDHSIIARSNVPCDAVVINQCDEDKVEEFKFRNTHGVECKVKFISTTERGLSKSRNMAIANSTADICVICDDDEVFPDDLTSIVSKAYNDIDKSDVIIFALERKDGNKKYPAKRKKIGLLQILKSSSHQITFRREKIDNIISFDEKMGSGTGNGGGEEIKFLLDCKKKGYGVFYSPEIIATVLPSDSQWFDGYTRKYMYNLGWTSRRLLGSFKGYAYILYQTVKKYPRYKGSYSLAEAFLSLHKGFCSKR